MVRIAIPDALRHALIAAAHDDEPRHNFLIEPRPIFLIAIHYLCTGKTTSTQVYVSI